jgi:predicted lipoprotein with Yx(FWY)xxD motif
MGIAPRRLLVTHQTIATLAAAGAAALAGCGTAARSDHQQMASSTASRTPASAASSQPTVKVASSDYGRILFDGRGRALYLFTRDRGSTSRCYGACAAAWPPYYAGGSAAAVAGNGASRALLGTTVRRDGRRQVTYAGHPVYHYVGDKKPGQILCQGVDEFGGTWLVLSSRGAAVR